MKSANNRYFSTIFFFILVASIVTGVLWRVSPSVNKIPDSDSGVFQYIGWRILQGEIPYLGVWDHKPPIIYFINAFGLRLSENSSWGIWCLEWFSLVISVILSFKIIRKVFNTISALVVTFLWLFSFSLLIEFGNLTEEYGLFLQFLSIYLFMQISWSRTAKFLPFTIGILAGLLFFLKQTLIGIPISIFICSTINGIIHRNYKSSIIESLYYISGVFSIFVLVITYFVINSSLEYFWLGAFVYNFSYSAVSVIERLNSLKYGLSLFFLPGLTIWAILGWLIFAKQLINRSSKKRTENIHNKILFLAFLDLPIEFLLSSLSGRLIVHYYIAWLPAMAILISLSIESLQTTIKKFFIEDRITNIGIIVIFSIIPIWFLISGYSGFLQKPYITPVRNRYQYSSQIVEYIQKITKYDESILILGAETSINFAARRSAPTRFVYQYPLVKTGFDSSEYEAEFFRDIEQNKPRIIIDATSTNLAFTTGTIGRLENTYRGQGFNQRVFATDYFKSSCKYDRKFGAWTAYLCE